MEKTKRFSLRRIMLAIAALAITTILVIYFFAVGEFNKIRDEFSGAVARGDQLAARDGLLKLQYFYDLNKNLKPFRLDGIADKYLFKDASLYQARYDFLTGNFEKVINKLKDIDDYRARWLTANARWRLAQGIFKDSLAMEAGTKMIMQKLAFDMAYSTKEDYEDVIKKDPDSTLPPKWNYDLTTDPAAMARALMPKPQKVKVILGSGGQDKGPSGKKGDGLSGEGSIKLDKRGGKKSGPNNRPGTRREG